MSTERRKKNESERINVWTKTRCETVNEINGKRRCRIQRDERMRTNGIKIKQIE